LPGNNVFDVRSSAIMHPTDQTSTERKKKYSDTTQFCMVSIKIAVTLGSLSGLQIIGSLRTYDGNCNEKRHIKIELLVKLSLRDYSMLITLYKIGEFHFR